MLTKKAAVQAVKGRNVLQEKLLEDGLAMAEKQISGFKMLSIEDRDLIYKYREDMSISDMGVTQLYAWQEKFQNQYQVIDGYLCILYQRDDGTSSCYAPLGPYEKEKYNQMLLKLKKELDERGIPFRFDFVPEDWLDRFGRLPGYEAATSCNDDFSDYIYEAEDFLNLSGKANEQKRYLVNYFKNHFFYEYRSMTTELLKDAYYVVEQWCQGRVCKECYWGCEKNAIMQILKNWEEFSCKGAVIYVDGVPKAFMIGEKIGKDMVVSHFQKADRRLKGLYAFISHEFYLREYPGIRYINLQEDMGIPGLRESKLSYRPIHMLKKYVVTLTERQG